MRWLSRRVLAVLLVLPVLGGAATDTLAQETPSGLVTLKVDGSPLLRGEGRRIEVTVSLERAAELRLRVSDFDGRLVRELKSGPTRAGSLTARWFGRDADQDRVPSGPYRIVASASAGDVTDRAEAWVTVADRAVYPRAPELITVAVDPGHGGARSGAVGVDGTREADLNLDIALRLTRMLEGAGVSVVITRTTDASVNEPPEERTGDGIIGDDDELAARPDLANGARADLFLSIHNNIAVNESVGGPSTFYFDERPFGDRSARLARIVQHEMVAALNRAVGGSWRPHDHGALIYPYYVLRGYDPPRLRRPTQMPGVLSEGMFLSNPRELALLERPAIRGAMAAAYYEAISKYLARRGVHIGYSLLDGPAEPAQVGARVRYAVEVRNQGSKPFGGGRLKVSAVDAPARYVSRVRHATSVGEAAIGRLEPGQTRTVRVTIDAPSSEGQWMLLFDAHDGDDRRAAELGSPMLQVRLTTVGPPSSASPLPSSSALPGTEEDGSDAVTDPT